MDKLGNHLWYSSSNLEVDMFGAEPELVTAAALLVGVEVVLWWAGLEPVAALRVWCPLFTAILARPRPLAQKLITFF